MKRITVALCVALALPAAFAKGGGHGGRAGGGHTTHAKPSGGGSHSVRGHTRKDGTYVAPHRQTNPNKSKRDNWSSKGNTNPYTGKEGTVDPEKR